MAVAESRSRAAIWLLLLASALASSGCGGAGDAAAPDAATSFIALAANFDGFCGWPSAPAGSADGGLDGVHASLGPLVVSWNKAPPHGATEFPVGTIIVKSSQEADVTKRTIFAMTKRQPRGTGYNPDGADGWEWWSLQQNPTDCTIQQLWRGIAPPSTETYASTSAGDCNTCHAQSRPNDYVADSALRLSSF